MYAIYPFLESFVHKQVLMLRFLLLDSEYICCFDEICYWIVACHDILNISVHSILVSGIFVKIRFGRDDVHDAV